MKALLIVVLLVALGFVAAIPRGNTKDAQFIQTGVTQMKKFFGFNKRRVSPRRTCEKVRTCLKAKVVCAEYSKEKKPVCKRFAADKKDKSKISCAEYAKQNECIRQKTICTKYRYLRRCFSCRRARKIFFGPSKCKEGQVLKYTPWKWWKRIVIRSCVNGEPEPVQMCYSFMDPHHYTYNTSSIFYDLQDAGDFVFARFNNSVFEAHYRLKSFGDQAGVVGYAVLLNGVDVVEYTADGGYRLNGRRFSLSEGESREFKTHGGSIQIVDGNTILLSPCGASLLVRNQTFALDMFLNTPESLIPSLRGVCQAEKVAARGLFSRPSISKYFETHFAHRKFDALSVSNAKILCDAQSIAGPQLGACMRDVLKAPLKDYKKVAADHGKVKKEVRQAKKLMTRIGILKRLLNALE